MKFFLEALASFRSKDHFSTVIDAVQKEIKKSRDLGYTVLMVVEARYELANMTV